MRVRLWGAVLLCLELSGLVAPRAYGQPTTLRFDLSKGEVADTVAVAPGRYALRVGSRVPKFVYAWTVQVRDIPIAPLKPSVFRDHSLAPCEDVIDAFAGLQKEEDVPKVVARGREVLAGTDAACGTEERASLQHLVDTTEVAYPDTFTVRANQVLVLTVTRTDPLGAAVRKWQRVYSAGTGGGWRTTFGFALLKTAGLARSGVFADAQAYTTKAVSNTTNKFVVTPDAQRSPLDAVPVIMFSYMDAGDRGLHWNRLTAGLGLDLTNPFVALGTGFTYNANLHLSAGVVARREDVLLGRYQSGDTVTSDLTGSQLASPAFRLRPMLAITFRFDSNPFSKGGSGGQTPATADAKSNASGTGGGDTGGTGSPVGTPDRTAGRPAHGGTGSGTTRTGGTTPPNGSKPPSS